MTPSAPCELGPVAPTPTRSKSWTRIANSLLAAVARSVVAVSSGGKGLTVGCSVVSFRSGEYFGPFVPGSWGNRMSVVVTLRKNLFAFLMAPGGIFFDRYGHELLLCIWIWVTFYSQLHNVKRVGLRIGSRGTEIFSPMLPALPPGSGPPWLPRSNSRIVQFSDLRSTSSLVSCAKECGRSQERPSVITCTAVCSR